jgi:hypothetical protein
MGSAVIESSRTRRSFIGAGVGGLVGAVAVAFGRPTAARAGHDATNVMHLGESNSVPADAATALEADVDGHALTIRNTNTGEEAGTIRAVGSASAKPVILAESDNENTFAVLGVSCSPGFTDFGGGNGTGVAGQSGGGTGVEGTSATGPGVSGQSQEGDGVAGHSQSGRGGSFSTEGGSFAVYIGGSAVDFALGVDNALVDEGAGGIIAVARGGKPAIEGDALPSEFGAGIGVLGVSSDAEFASGPGIGVQGLSGAGVGVQAMSSEGVALDVVGKARYSTAGSGAVPAGQQSVAVSNPAVTAESHITVSLTSNPGNRQVRWVERDPGTGFTVHLVPTPPNQRPLTTLTYLIVEPGS